MATIRNRHVALGDLPVQLEVGASEAAACVEGGDTLSFRVYHADTLTRRLVDDEVIAFSSRTAKPVLVTFERASPEARAELRGRRISYLSGSGECFLFAPPLYIDRPAPRPTAHAARVSQPGTRNPFAKRSSRVVRWLLLHPNESLSIRELARATSLSEPLTSRVVRSLDEAALVRVQADHEDARMKQVSIRRPREALDAWRNAWESRRIPTVDWTIGTRDREETFDLVVRAGRRSKLDWALGGLAGASLIQRVVEPRDVLLWVPSEAIDAWSEALLPSPAPRGQGLLRVRPAPDDFVFDLTSDRGEVRLADPVQLWLDCATAGERALEAADAIAQEMSW